jgi:DNA repair protein RadA/Sms
VAKSKSRWVCQECGFQTSGYLGRCTECGKWGTVVEELIAEPEPVKSTVKRAHSLQREQRAAAASFGDAGPSPSSAGPMPLYDLHTNESQMARISTGLQALDEVLGGGFVPGSVILLAGDPGIGKSTLLLQVSNNVAEKHKVLYVSGEESASQVKLRAERLGVKRANVLACAEQDVMEIREHILNSGVRLAIVDSIQAIFHPQIGSAPGSVSQVRETANMLVGVAKAQDVTTIIVGHVTKDGSIAGPRVLEHMVDVVLHFEGDRSRQVRLLKTPKNRFGSTQEIAVFKMTEQGLAEVENPSALFLGDRLTKLGRKQAPSGTAVIAGGEGSRSLLIEVQALVGNSPYTNPRRVANGWDYNRLLQILAVLEKKIGLFLSKYDVYVNIAGGMDFSDPSGDLGISLAVTTSILDRSVDPGLLCIGEIGLTGEVRPVVALGQRLKEAAKLGFRRAIVPKGNLPLDIRLDNMEVTGVELLSEALTLAIPGTTFPLTYQRGQSESGRQKRDEKGDDRMPGQHEERALSASGKQTSNSSWQDEETMESMERQLK